MTQEALGTNDPTPRLRPTADATSVHRSAALAFASEAAIRLLGGMIGPGGAEFRLPVLISVFGFVALQAVILNKALRPRV
jgi:hypothetical protein